MEEEHHIVMIYFHFSSCNYRFNSLLKIPTATDLNLSKHSTYNPSKFSTVKSCDPNLERFSIIDLCRLSSLKSRYSQLMRAGTWARLVNFYTVYCEAYKVIICCIPCLRFAIQVVGFFVTLNRNDMFKWYFLWNNIYFYCVMLLQILTNHSYHIFICTFLSTNES
jgi:hypothetical protein